MHLVKLKKEDSSEIAALHCAAFKGFFLTDLGVNVLRVFYSSLIQDKATIIWGIKLDKVLVGFFLASTNPNNLYKRIFKINFFNFFIPLSISFLKNLNLLRRMIISMASSKSFEVPSIYTASLLSICVEPAFSGKGIGKILLGKLEAELINNNHHGYYLTTDTDNNDATNYFYLRNGFLLHQKYLQGKRRMNVYLKKLK